MARYDVQVGNEKYTVEAPEGVNPEELVQQALGGQQPGQPARKQFDEARQEFAKGESFATRALAGLGKAADEAIGSVQQLTGAGWTPEREQELAENRKIIDEAGPAALLGQVAGEIGLTAIPALKLSKALNAANTVRRGAALSAGIGAGEQALLHPALEGDTRPGEAAKGAAAGLAGDAVVRGAGRLFTGALRGGRSQAAQDFINSGGKLTLAQQLASSERYPILGRALSKIEGIGGVTFGPDIAIRPAQLAPLRGYTAVAMQRSLPPGAQLGNTIKEISENPQLVEELPGKVRQAYRDAYTNLWNSVPVVNLPRGFSRSPGVQAALDQQIIPDGVRRTIVRWLQNNIDIPLERRAGRATGEEAAEMLSNLGKMINEQRGEPTVASALRSIRDELESILVPQMTPQQQARWNAIGQQYRMWKTVKEAKTSLEEGLEGTITPKSLYRAMQKRGATAPGTPLHALYEMGAGTTGQAIPAADSTARSLGKSMLGGLLLGAAGGVPAILGGAGAGYGAGRAIVSPFTARFALGETSVQQALASRIAELLRAGVPATTLAEMMNQ